MKQSNLRIVKLMLIPVLLVAFLLFSGVGCGGNKPPTPAATTAAPSDTVDDTKDDTTAPEPTPTIEEDTPTPISGDFKRRTKRDPFIPVVQPHKENVPVPTVVAVNPNPIDDTPVMPTKTGPTEIDASTVGVEVTGIMRVGGGYQAILTGSGGKSYLVRVGQKLGDYKVAQITRDMVVLKTNDYIARLRLKEDIKTPGGKKPGQPNDAGPKAPAPPPQPY